MRHLFVITIFSTLFLSPFLSFAETANKSTMQKMEEHQSITGQGTVAEGLKSFEKNQLPHGIMPIPNPHGIRKVNGQDPTHMRVIYERYEPKYNPEKRQFDPPPPGGHISIEYHYPDGTVLPHGGQPVDSDREASEFEANALYYWWEARGNNEGLPNSEPVNEETNIDEDLQGTIENSSTASQNQNESQQTPAKKKDKKKVSSKKKSKKTQKDSKKEGSKDKEEGFVAWIKKIFGKEESEPEAKPKNQPQQQPYEPVSGQWVVNPDKLTVNDRNQVNQWLRDNEYQVNRNDNTQLRQLLMKHQPPTTNNVPTPPGTKPTVIPPPPGPVPGPTAKTTNKVTLIGPDKISNPPRLWKNQVDGWNAFLDTAPPGVNRGTIDVSNPKLVNNVKAWYDNAVTKLNNYKKSIDNAWKNATDKQKAKHKKEYEQFQKEYKEAMEKLVKGKKQLFKLSSAATVKSAVSATVKEKPISKPKKDSQPEEEESENDSHHEDHDIARDAVRKTIKHQPTPRPTPPRVKHGCP